MKFGERLRFWRWSLILGFSMMKKSETTEDIYVKLLLLIHQVASECKNYGQDSPPLASCLGKICSNVKCILDAW